jgi:hypothetical protein
VSEVHELEREAAAAIKAAFPVGTPLPAEEVRNSHCPECLDVAAIFADKTWPQVTVGDLEGNVAISLMSPVAFHYHLPALMLRCIEATTQLDLVPDSVVSALAPAGGKTNVWAEHALSGFNRAQIAAILAFLYWREAEQTEEWIAGGLAREHFAELSTSRVLSRAIKYWSTMLHAA